jgi:flavodoxin short chain
MNKIAVVYWSGTGNTETMATKVAEGATSAGADATVFNAYAFKPEMLDDFDAVAFGCPSMGCEQLEDGEFEPMFISCEPKLNGKKIALFGSYGWGDGEWMRTWEDNCKTDGAVLVCDSVICNDAPDHNAQAECISLGEALAKA